MTFDDRPLSSLRHCNPCQLQYQIFSPDLNQGHFRLRFANPPVCSNEERSYYQPKLKGWRPARCASYSIFCFTARRADKTLRELPPELLPDILVLIDDEKVGRLIVRAGPDDAVSIIDSLPDERRERVLALLDPERQAAVREIINYPEGTVGRIMIII